MKNLSNSNSWRATRNFHYLVFLYRSVQMGARELLGEPIKVLGGVGGVGGVGITLR